MFNDELAHPQVLAYRNVQKPLNLATLIVQPDTPLSWLNNANWARSQNCERRLSASSSLTVCPHGIRLPTDGFTLNLMFEYFSKICPQNSSSI
jgi:hypothetical protein